LRVVIEFLREKRDLFAWQPSDMPSVPRELAEHSLNIYHDAKPVKQSIRCFGPERQHAISKEIPWLQAAGFIREVIHTEWLANPVLVPKKNTTELRMCIDYTALN
jgi:hypothetical protein